MRLLTSKRGLLSSVRLAHLTYCISRTWRAPPVELNAFNNLAWQVTLAMPRIMPSRQYPSKVVTNPLLAAIA